MASPAGVRAKPLSPSMGGAQLPSPIKGGSKTPSPIKGGAQSPSWSLLLETKPRPAAENMARDEYLFRLCHESKRGFFRIYAWERPSFSTGVSQKAGKALNLDFIKANGCDYVRRISGGKTVLHDQEITYAVASSEDIFFKEHDLHQSYLLISRVLVQALQSLGVKATLSKGSPSELSRSHNPCFSFPTPNEIEVNGKKIIGSAQKRDKQALLQHGSIPLTMNYDLYASGANFSPDLLARSMTTWNDISGRSSQELIAALVQSFKFFIGTDFYPMDFNQEDQKQLAILSEKYGSDAWNLVL
jgi:lipoate-protein ligase A